MFLGLLSGIEAASHQTDNTLLVKNDSGVSKAWIGFSASHALLSLKFFDK